MINSITISIIVTMIKINLPSNCYYRLELYLLIMKIIMEIIEEIRPKLIIFFLFHLIH